MPADQSYDVDASSRWWTARFVAATCPRGWRRRLVQVDMSEVVGPVLVHLHRDGEPRWSAPLLSAAVDHLQQAFVARPPSVRIPDDPRARRIADALIDDPASRMELADWAPTVGASERTLRRLFLQQTGLPFGRWRTQLRLCEAMRLLTDGHPVGEVARQAGYSSNATFTRAFVAEVGLAPTRFASGSAAVDAVVPEQGREWPGEQTERPHGHSGLGKHLVELLEQLTGDQMRSWSNRAAMFGVGATLMLAACSDGDDSSSASTPTDATSNAAAATTAPTPASEEADAAPGLAAFPDFDAPVPIFEVVEERDDTLVVRHAFGETEIPRDPERIATDDTTLEIFLSLGITPVASQSRFADGVTPAPEVEPLLADVELFSRGVTNLEALAALEPDLIIGPEWVGFEDDPEGLYELLSEIAPTIITSDDPAGYWQAATEVVAETFDRTDRLEALEATFEAQVEAQCDRIRSVIGPDDTVSHIEMYDGGFFFLIAPGFTVDGRYLPLKSTTFAFTECGLNPGPENAELALTDNVQLSLEVVEQIQADHLFLTVFPGAEQTLDDVSSSALWGQIPSVANDSVYEAPPLVWWSYLSYPWALEQRADAVVGA